MSIQVFDVVKIVTVSRNKIVSVTAAGDRVFVSCKDGNLLVYQLENSRFLDFLWMVAEPIHFSEKMSIPYFSDSKKGTPMMKSILKWNFLLALTDKGISVFEFLFFSFVAPQVR